MAKAFYSMEEVCELLGKTEDEIKALVREGTLREFRDAGKIFFRAEQIHKLSGTEPASEDSGEIMLESVSEEAPATDEAELPTLADSEGTSVLGLEPLDETPASAPPAAEPKGEDKSTVISASGIGVFDDDELEIDADPMAETQITASPGEDVVALEGTGSGSGLLDLTHEPDDTKLGAELLDEIYPGEEDVATAPVAAAEPEEELEEAEEEEEAVEEAAPAAAEEVAAPAAYIVAGDPSEGMFSGLLVGAILLLALAGSVVAASLQGFFPDYAEFLTNQFWIFLGGAAGLVIISLLLGWVIGKAGAPRKA